MIEGFFAGFDKNYVVEIPFFISLPIRDFPLNGSQIDSSHREKL